MLARRHPRTWTWGGGTETSGHAASSLHAIPFSSPSSGLGKGLAVVVPPAAMFWLRDRGWAERGWWQGPALPLSSMPGRLRARGLDAFPENTAHCLPGLALSPGPALSHGRIRSELPPSRSPERITGSQAWWSPLCGMGTPGPPLQPCSVGEAPVVPGSPSQTSGAVPRTWGSRRLHVAAFRAGGQPLESSKEGLCFQGRRQGRGRLPLLSSPSLPGQGACS